MKKYEVEKILNLEGKGEWAVVRLEKQDDGEILRVQMGIYEDEMEAIEVATDLINDYKGNKCE